MALGFLERTDGIYRNAPCADAFLDKRKPSYIGGILEMANARLYGFWGNLTEALRTGERQNESKHDGTPLFQELYADPERLRQFAAAMSGTSRGVNLEIAKRFPWADVTTFADIGTAQGDTAVQIALAHPHLTGYGFDLPPLAPVFEDYANQNQIGASTADGPGCIPSSARIWSRRARASVLRAAASISTMCDSTDVPWISAMPFAFA